MIRFPVLEHLDVDSYALLPGTEEQPGIHFDFQNGISVIAGINGLGKTTLINMLFRLVVGPFELPKLTGSKFGAIAREKEIPWVDRRTYFAQRVVDRAANANASLTFRIGQQRFSVTRTLSDCKLREAYLNGHALLSEIALQNEMFQAMGVGSFVDFLTVVKFLTFFNEDRRDILWDDQAQRQFLRILFAPPETSVRWIELEQKINSADSAARSASAFAHTLKTELEDMERLLASNQGVRLELAAAQKIFDADLERNAKLEQRAEELRLQVSKIVQQLERAKLAQDAARRVVEELRYTALQRLFPSLDETAQYILTHLFGDHECLACGADASGEIARLNKAITEGICPICGADPSKQTHAHTDKVVPVHEVEKRKLDRAIAKLESVRVEVEAAAKEEDRQRTELDSMFAELEKLGTSIEDQRLANANLRAKLPPDSGEVRNQRNALQKALETEASKKAERARIERSYKALLAVTEEIFRAAAIRITSRFRKFAPAFLEEECSLSFKLVQDRPSQSGAHFQYPSLKFEMSAATFETRQVRSTPDDVSESQREFVDLAFRMALMEAASHNQAATLVVETPEASLDAIFMVKAGEMLRAFGADQRRIIVTTNLTSSAMLPALFGGKARSQAEVGRRWERVIDLLDVAEPNAAARKFGSRYKAFLEAGIEGRSE